MAAGGSQEGWRRRPLIGALGLRPPVTEHTPDEGELLRRAARGARRAVEIGVAEGGSARDLREVIDPGGTLALIDPYPNGRLGTNMQRIVARRTVEKVEGAEVVWLRGRSQEVVKTWDGDIDFLFIDGDHSYEGVRRDWEDWAPHVVPDGTVVLHDARQVPGGWVSPDDGPARLLAEVDAEGSGWKVVDAADSAVVLRRVGG